MAISHIDSYLPSQNDQRSEQERTYEKMIVQLTQSFIYDKGVLQAEDIEEQIAEAAEDPAIKELESQNHHLEAVRDFLLGTEGYERANRHFAGSWQSAIRKQSQRKISSANLTREDVQEKWESYTYRKELLGAEESAINAYRAFLKTDMPCLQVTDRIFIERSDVEGLLNDLETRRAERIESKEERTEAIGHLDDELVQIIDRVPSEEFGRKMELMEIALIRNLIHQNGAEHLVSVYHGSPREDMNPDLGSVDFWIVFAGNAFPLQVKTFKSSSRRNFYMQDTVAERANKQLAQSKTRLVTLNMESVRDAYERMLRQEHFSKRDKYEALKPIADSLGEDGKTLFGLLGLNEEELRAEEEAFHERYQEMLRVREENREIEKRRAEEEARAEEAYRARIAQELLEKEARERERVRREEEILRASEEERQRLEEERKRKAEGADTKWQQGLKEAEERRKREALEAERARIKREKEEERKRKRAEREKMPSWPPKKIADLGIVHFLAKLGITAQDGAEYIRVKKHLLSLIGKPARGKTEVDEIKSAVDKNRFLKLFPTNESYETPSSEDVNRIREALGVSEDWKEHAA